MSERALATAGCFGMLVTMSVGVTLSGNFERVGNGACRPTAPLLRTEFHAASIGACEMLATVTFGSGFGWTPASSTCIVYRSPLEPVTELHSDSAAVCFLGSTDGSVIGRDSIAAASAQVDATQFVDLGNGCCQTKDGGSGKYVVRDRRTLEGCRSLCLETERCVAVEFQVAMSRCELHYDIIVKSNETAGNRSPCRCFSRRLRETLSTTTVTPTSALTTISIELGKRCKYQRDCSVDEYCRLSSQTCQGCRHCFLEQAQLCPVKCQPWFTSTLTTSQTTSTSVTTSATTTSSQSTSQSSTTTFTTSRTSSTKTTTQTTSVTTTVPLACECERCPYGTSGICKGPGGGCANPLSFSLKFCPENFVTCSCPTMSTATTTTTTNTDTTATVTTTATTPGTTKTTFSCLPNEWKCGTVDECILREWVCDDIYFPDCSDSSDEAHCNRSTTAVASTSTTTNNSIIAPATEFVDGPTSTSGGAAVTEFIVESTLTTKETPKCATWCAGYASSWSMRCTFTNCGGCSDCDFTSSTVAMTMSTKFKLSTGSPCAKHRHCSNVEYCSETGFCDLCTNCVLDCPAKCRCDDVVCQASSQCHSVGLCVAGLCTNPTIDGVSCDDGKSDTFNDTCSAGVCAGITKSVPTTMTTLTTSTTAATTSTITTTFVTTKKINTAVVTTTLKSSSSQAAYSSTTTEEPTTDERKRYILRWEDTQKAIALSSLTINVGDTVTWIFVGPHNLIGDPMGTFPSEIRYGDDGFEHTVTFLTPGTFPYHCQFHSNMHATVTVVDSAITSSIIRSESYFTSTLKTSTSIADPCNLIVCAINCVDECGWSSRSNTCNTGSRTDFAELRAGECDEVSTLAPISDYLVSTFTTKSSESNPCSNIACAVECTGQCGWSLRDSKCILGGKTSNSALRVAACNPEILVGAECKAHRHCTTSEYCTATGVCNSCDACWLGPLWYKCPAKCNVTITATTTTAAVATTISSTTIKSTIPTSSTTSAQVCTDKTLANGSEWHDSGGPDYNCAFYAGDIAALCNGYGNDYVFESMAADDACCACGGGTLLSNTLTSSTITATTTTTTAAATTISSTTIKSTIPTSSTTSAQVCTDKTLANGSEWHDSGGPDYNCAFYAGDIAALCNGYGNDYVFESMAADDACCACGGGTLLSNTLTSSTITDTSSTSLGDTTSASTTTSDNTVKTTNPTENVAGPILWQLTQRGCRCKQNWSPGDYCGGTPDLFNSCGMRIPCDEDSLNSEYSTWCVVEDAGCGLATFGSIELDWDYCNPLTIPVEHYSQVDVNDTTRGEFTSNIVADTSTMSTTTALNTHITSIVTPTSIPSRPSKSFTTMTSTSEYITSHPQTTVDNIFCQSLIWTDIDGETCDDYELYDYCGAGWNIAALGELNFYTPPSGVAAKEACCSCGGGLRGATTISNVVAVTTSTTTTAVKATSPTSTSFNTTSSSFSTSSTTSTRPSTRIITPSGPVDRIGIDTTINTSYKPSNGCSRKSTKLIIKGRIGYNSQLNGNYNLTPHIHEGRSVFQARDGFKIFWVPSWGIWAISKVLGSSNIYAFLPDTSAKSAVEVMAETKFVVWDGAEWVQDVAMAFFCTNH